MRQCNEGDIFKLLPPLRNPQMVLDLPPHTVPSLHPCLAPDWPIRSASLWITPTQEPPQRMTHDKTRSFLICGWEQACQDGPLAYLPCKKEHLIIRVLWSTQNQPHWRYCSFFWLSFAVKLAELTIERKKDFPSARGPCDCRFVVREEC